MGGTDGVVLSIADQLRCAEQWLSTLPQVWRLCEFGRQPKHLPSASTAA